ncbi:hypothetical protein GGX14DRAFT_144927 [Mycena pura]|uniref:CxC5 like cysteine cluster associated with KDZ domain-containing protein n=1 Tax=Mycena pura TaxID=153505 RepID=A0AAD7E1W7_9AGAR|nr:hypothetical protein GGX14DRAFT_144927 [Mycena pura]
MSSCFCNTVSNRASVRVYSLSPPTRVCLDPYCRKPLRSDPSILRDKELDGALHHRITVFTLELGAVPGYSTSCYCRRMFFNCSPFSCVDYCLRL